MNHLELNQLFKAHQETLGKWERELVSHVHSFYRKVFALLQPVSEQWIDPTNSTLHPYVELLDISQDCNQPKQFVPASFGQSVSEAGELMFSIGVVLEIAPNAYPKTHVHFPYLARFKDGSVEFVSYDTNTQAIESGETWNKDVDALAASLINKMETYLRFDPFQGPSDRRKMGFY